MNGVPNKPMVPTVASRPRHIGQPLGSNTASFFMENVSSTTLREDSQETRETNFNPLEE